MVLFHLRFMISAKNLIFPFLMGMFPVVPLMGYTFHSLLGLLECAVM